MRYRLEMALQTCPVDVGDRLNVQIEAQTPAGQGVAKLDGFVIFVDGAKAGQKVKIVIYKCARTYANARRIE